MSSTLEICQFPSIVNTNNNSTSSPKSYNDLINYCSIRKQLLRIIPQYMSIGNQKIISKNKYSSNIEEFRKCKQEIISLKESISLLKEKKQRKLDQICKQEIISLKESISLLKEKKQRKLDQIEELRRLMRKVGNKNNNNNSPLKCKDNYHVSNNHNERETREQRNNDQRFRGNSNNDKKQCFAKGTTGSCEDNEGGLSLVPSTSGLSSGKDDDTAPEGGNYQDLDNQEDFILSISNSSSSYSSCSNNNLSWRWCFGVEKDKAEKPKGLQEKDCALVEKEN